MCGIVGIVGAVDVAQRLFDGLKRLEYRGYDSAGICTIDERRARSPPRRGQARQSGARARRAIRCPARPASRTRAGRRMARRPSATPTRTSSAPVALVHNGIIENFKPLRDELIAAAASSRARPTPRSSPISSPARSSAALRPQDAVAAVLPRLHGAFALAILFRDHPDLLIGARLGSPLTVGYGDGENYLGSDALALAPLTQRIAYLDEGDWAVITPRRHRDLRPRQPAGRARDRRVRRVVGAGREGQLPPLHAEGDLRAADRRRPDAAVLPPPARRRGRAARRRISTSASIERVTIVACGTASTPGWSPNTGSSSSRACRSTSMSRASSATASRCCEPGGAGARSSRSRARPPTRSPRCATCKAQGAADRGRRQRADQLDGARGRPAAADPCRAGDRRRLDQGVHLPARGAGRARRPTSRAPRAG